MNDMSGDMRMKIIDLSHKLVPDNEEYKLKLDTYQIEELYPQYHRSPDDWYIVQNVEFIDHVGTHIESPYHHRKDGWDISGIPLTSLVGEGVKLEFTHKKPNERISVEELQKVAGNRIKKGDIVLFHTGRDKFYHNIEESHERPYPTSEAINWLVSRQISCVGIDCTGIEVKGINDQPNHKSLFAENIPLIENVTNLEEITEERFLVVILPVNIAGLESFPVRMIAIEQLFDNYQKY